MALKTAMLRPQIQSPIDLKTSFSEAVVISVSTSLDLHPQCNTVRCMLQLVVQQFVATGGPCKRVVLLVSMFDPRRA